MIHRKTWPNTARKPRRTFSGGWVLFTGIFFSGMLQAQVLVDNGAAGTNTSTTSFTGAWCRSGLPGAYGLDSLYSCGLNGQQAATYRWTPALPTSQRYQVMMRWVPGANRGAAIPVTIKSASGTSTTLQNMRQGGGWVSLGESLFMAGTSGYVEVQGALAGNEASADVVQWIPVAPQSASSDVTDIGTAFVSIPAPTGSGSRDLAVIHDGIYPPEGSINSALQFDTYNGQAHALDFVGYTFPTAQTFSQVIYQQGMNFWDGGWFTGVNVEVRVNGQWQSANASVTPSYPNATGVYFKTFTFNFNDIVGDGIRIAGAPGGTAGFISVAELRVFAKNETSPLTDLTPLGQPTVSVTNPTGGGNKDLRVIADGEFPAEGSIESNKQYDTYNGLFQLDAWAGYTFATPQVLSQLKFQQGIYFADGGWLVNPTVQIRNGGEWINVASTVAPAYDSQFNLFANVNFRTYIFSFAPVSAEAIRIYGTPAGSATFLSVGELRVFGTSLGQRPPLPSTTNVLTQHNDNFRTGGMTDETHLNTSNVRPTTFGKLFSRNVDGQIYAQPLYVSNVNIPGKGVHNVVIVATMKNKLYAYDADYVDLNAPLWMADLGEPVPANRYFPPWNENISGSIGIVSTPVIDLTTKTLYTVSTNNAPNSRATHSLHALNLETGLPKSNSPVRIQGQVVGQGMTSVDGIVKFDSNFQMQRSSLLLIQGKLYFAFAAYADILPYFGWVLGYDPNTLAQIAIFNTNPDSSGGGIWMSGQGLAGDTDGSLYFATGNGFNVDPAKRFASDLDNAIIRLTTGGVQGLIAKDWFMPSNWPFLNQYDVDLGVSGVLLLPDTRLAVGGSKEGKVYLVNRDNLGHIADDNGIVQTFRTPGEHIHGAPVYWQGANGNFIYIQGEQDYLSAYKIENGYFQPRNAPSPTSRSTFKAVDGSMPGGILSVSSNKSVPGTGIVWTSFPESGNAQLGTVPGILHAVDASDLSKDLWNSGMNKARDGIPTFAKFCPPTIANGKVYVATFSNQLLVYGLLNP